LNHALVTSVHGLFIEQPGDRLVAVELLKQGETAGGACAAWSRRWRGCHMAHFIVLIDLDMPVMDGCRATAHIRCNPDWGVYSGCWPWGAGVLKDRARAERAGSTAAFQPVLPQALFAALFDWVARRRRHRAGETED